MNRKINDIDQSLLDRALKGKWITIYAEEKEDQWVNNTINVHSWGPRLCTGIRGLGGYILLFLELEYDEQTVIYIKRQVPTNTDNLLVLVREAYAAIINDYRMEVDIFSKKLVDSATNLSNSLLVLF